MQDREFNAVPLEALRAFSTPIMADAIALLNIRLRNQGYSDSSVRSIFTRPMPMVGYAVTGRLRSSEPPMVKRSFVERADWFQYIETIPEPRIAVLQDVDSKPGVGAFWDEVHARVHLRLGCIGAIMNGAVRELPGIEQTSFYLFAGNTTVAQGYAHIIEIGHPVEIGGMVIHPGDLLHGDVHGFLNIPQEAAAKLPQAAERILQIRKQITELCASPELSVGKLLALMKELE